MDRNQPPAGSSIMNKPETAYEKNDRLMKELTAELERWSAQVASRKGREGRRCTDKLK
jgi:hypothetical protein